MAVPEVAGLDGAWLKPTLQSAAARRLVYAGAPGAAEVWTPPFRLMHGLATMGRTVAHGAALELPLAAWTLAPGTGGSAAAEWTVDLRRAWPEGEAGAGELEVQLSDDGARLLATSGDQGALGLFACRGGRMKAEPVSGGVRVRCDGPGEITLAALGAVDPPDLDRTLDQLARRGLAGLARQRLQHDDQVVRGGAAVTLADDEPAAARFAAARHEADASLVELPGVGRAPLARLPDDAQLRPGVFRIRSAARTGLGLVAAGLREQARDTLRFVARCTERAGAVPFEVSLSGVIAAGDARDAGAFVHLAERHFAWTADTAVRDEVAGSVARARLVAIAGQDGHGAGAGEPLPSAGEVLRTMIEDAWGIEPDASGGSVRIRPQLPAGDARAALSRLRIGRTILDLRLRRRGPTAQLSVRKVMGPPLVVDCALPDLDADAVELDGVSLGAAHARFEATGEHEFIVHAAG